MDSSNSQSDYGKIPGQFPSPTPSPVSDVPETDEQPATTTPHPLSHDEPIILSDDEADDFDYTASGPSRQRPLFSGTQSEWSLQHRKHRRNSPVTPLRSGIRPMHNRRAVSDTQHDRLMSRTDQSHSSPTGRPHRRAPQPGSSHSDNKAPLTAQKVHEEIRTKLRKKLNPDFRTGVVYILRDPARPHLLKIGSTQDLSQRLRHHDRSCNITFDIVFRSDEIRNYARAETLANADLGHVREKFFCIPCSKFHQEYFKVDKEIAKTVVKRWAAFIREQPYDADGQLKGIWHHIIFHREGQIYTGGAWSHAERWNCWDSMLAPLSRLDYCRYVISSVRNHPIWLFLWKFPWQVYAVVSWCVTCYVSPSTLTLVILFLTVLSVLASMSPYLPGLPRAKKR